ncbi:MAG: DNA mismatch repair protein MutS, partial [Deltaproteobacteria bacterium]|nr:DNA mismatch repair protein MutS [Deltaproteobacteria bacterium]
TFGSSRAIAQTWAAQHSKTIQPLETSFAADAKVLRELEPYAASAYLVLDESTRTNLELVANTQGERKGSLLAVIDPKKRFANGKMGFRSWWRILLCARISNWG